MLEKKDNNVELYITCKIIPRLFFDFTRRSGSRISFEQ